MSLLPNERDNRDEVFAKLDIKLSYKDRRGQGRYWGPRQYIAAANLQADVSGEIDGRGVPQSWCRDTTE